MSRRGFEVVMVACATLGLAFLALPVIALFLRTTPAELLDALTSAAVGDALLVSLRTSLVAHVLILGIGTPLAYLLATEDFPGKKVALTVVELPLVLPPAVAGIGLLAAFGRRGVFGSFLHDVGIGLPFTEAAVVLAITFVAAPFYIRPAVAAFAAADAELLEAAEVMGLGRWKIFRQVALPLAAPSLGAGSALAFARGIGEFGATIMFAGSFRGVTETLPLAIYGSLNQDFDVALAIGGLLVVVSVSLLLAIKVVPAWTRSLSISASRSGTSS